MADINPKPEDVAAKVGAFRDKFKTKRASDISAGKYDPRDLERLEKDDAYARCFLRTLKSKGNIDKAIEVVHEAFKFRKEIGIWDINDSTIPAWVLERRGMYYQNKDKDGHPILYINVKENTATKEQMADLKKFIAYNFEKHHRENPEQMCVVLMDMSGAGTSNVNTDVTKYIITCFTHYFPAYLAYMINYEMPFALTAIWTVISAFLNSEQKAKLLMVKKKDIKKYINEDNLWPHMK